MCVSRVRNFSFPKSFVTCFQQKAFVRLIYVMCLISRALFFCVCDPLWTFFGLMTKLPLTPKWHTNINTFLPGTHDRPSEAGTTCKSVSHWHMGSVAFPTHPVAPYPQISSYSASVSSHWTIRRTIIDKNSFPRKRSQVLERFWEYACWRVYFSSNIILLNILFTKEISNIFHKT